MDFKKFLSSAIFSSAQRMGRGASVAACCMLLLGVSWSCSSNDEVENADPTPQATHSTFASAERPNWYVDWTSSDPMPDWQEPLSFEYECSMDMLVNLDPLLIPFSTDDDQLAVFINGTCRAVSKRNEYAADGTVVFLVHVKASSEEVGQNMEVRYYSGGAHQLFITTSVPPFTANNILDEAFSFSIDPVVTSTKYTFSTQLEVFLPDELPFVISEDDQLAVFVGNECRGVLVCGNEIAFEGWRGVVSQVEDNEQAYVRYYSAEKGGIYTFSETITLNSFLMGVHVKF